MTILSAFLLGAVSMLLAQLLVVCVLALLCWSGARRAGESLERAAEAVRPVRIDGRPGPPPAPNFVALSRLRGGVIKPGGRTMHVGVDEREFIATPAEMARMAGPSTVPPLTIHVDLKRTGAAAPIKAACSCGQKIPGDGWAHSWRGCYPGWPSLAEES